MKNSLLIDFDTDREVPISITKGEDSIIKVNDDESAKKMLMMDIITLSNALGTLIQIGDDSGHFNSESTAKLCINFFNENFLDKK